MKKRKNITVKLSSIGCKEKCVMNRTLPIGNDQFRLVREKSEYYVDRVRDDNR